MNEKKIRIEDIKTALEELQEIDDNTENQAIRKAVLTLQNTLNFLRGLNK